MKRRIICAVVFLLACCLPIWAYDWQAQTLPELLFAHIETSGSHVMLADKDNHVGQGEEVAISKDFYMARHAVSNLQWQQFITQTARQAPSYWNNGTIPEGKEQHPVVWVSADEAEAYCQWLEKQYPDYTFRLPTQGEWEYVACGNQRTVYPWGNQADVTYKDGALTSRFNFNAVIGAFILQKPEQLATFNNPKSTRYGEQEQVKNIFSISQDGSVSGWIDHGNYLGFVYTDLFTAINETGGYTCAVDAYPEGASQWGCYNMSGNCWEWTSTIEEATNGAERGQMVNIIKGGSWYATKGSCKVSYRGEGRKGSGRYATVGIRVVAEKRNTSGINRISGEKHRDYYSSEGCKIRKPASGLVLVRQDNRITKKILKK